jgi:hypothetical protein
MRPLKNLFVNHKSKSGKMKKIIIAAIIILSGFVVMAQDGSSAIGLRGGGLSGMTIKLVDDDLRAVEILFGFQRNGMKMTGMLQRFKPIKTDRISNLYMFSGLGAHAGFERWDQEETQVISGVTYYSYHRAVSPVIGGDLIVGIEYHFESVPFHVSLDYKPYMEFFGEKIFRIDFWDIGFSVRYIINQ